MVCIFFLKVDAMVKYEIKKLKQINPHIACNLNSYYRGSMKSIFLWNWHYFEYIWCFLFLSRQMFLGDCYLKKGCSLCLKLQPVRFFFFFFFLIFNVQSNDSIGYTFHNTSGFSSIYTHLMIPWFKMLQLINSAITCSTESLSLLLYCE